MKAISSFFFVVLSFYSYAQLAINEVAVTGGLNDWIEFLVVGNCGDNQDIRGYIFDDNNGRFGVPSGSNTKGIAQGSLRFSAHAQWENIPVGSLVLIYDPTASGIPAEDPTDANCDGVYVIRMNDPTFLERNINFPNATGSLCFSTTYPSSCTDYPVSDWILGGSINVNKLRAGGDAIQIYAPNPSIAPNPETPLFSISWGDNSDHKFIYFSSVTSGNTIEALDNPLSKNFQKNTSGGTPGFPNSCANHQYISSLRAIHTNESNPNLACKKGTCKGWNFQNLSIQASTGTIPAYTTTTLLTKINKVIPSFCGVNSTWKYSILEEWTVASSYASLSSQAPVKTENNYLCANALEESIWSLPVFNNTSCQTQTATYTLKLTPVLTNSIQTLRLECESIAQSVTVFILPQSIAAPTLSSTLGTEFCSNLTTTIQAAGNFSTLEWNTGAKESSILVNNSGTYSVRGQNSMGCWSDFSRISIQINPTPSVPILTSDISEFCAGKSAKVWVNSPYSVRWEDGVLDRERIFLTPQTPRIQSISEKNCYSDWSQPLYFTIHPKPATPIVSYTSKTEFCAGDSTVLEIICPENLIHWNISELQTNVKTMTVKKSGIFSVRSISDKGCYSETSNIIKTKRNEIPPRPTIITKPKHYFCQGDSAILEIKDTLNFFWNVNSAQPIQVSKKSEFFKVYYQDSNGCISPPDSIFTEMKPLPPVPTVSVQTLYTSKISIPASSTQYFWYSNDSTFLGEGLEFKFRANETYRIEAKKTYKLPEVLICKSSSSFFRHTIPSYATVGVVYGTVSEGFFTFEAREIPSTPVKVRIWTPIGQLLYDKEAIFKLDKIQLDLTTVGANTLILEIISKDFRYVRRLMVL